MTVRLRQERGQVTVLTAVFMLVLLGMAGFVLDVGSWFRAQRLAQTTVDAAALAGAQSLPGDTGTAGTWARDFAAKNGGVAGAVITFSTRYEANDVITVKQTAPAPTFFSKLFGFSSVTVGAKASALAELPASVMGVAPIAVDIHHQYLSGPGCPCFNVPTTLPLGKKGAPARSG